MKTINVAFLCCVALLTTTQLVQAQGQRKPLTTTRPKQVQATRRPTTTARPVQRLDNSKPTTAAQTVQRSSDRQSAPTTPSIGRLGNSKMTLLHLDLYKGTGYSNITFGAGLNGAYHKPLGKDLVFVGRAGFNFYRYTYFASGVGYGYSGIPGDLPTLYVYGGTESASALSLPATIGLRLYVPTLAQGAHIDAGIGAEFGIYHTSTSFLFMPGVGYMLPLSGGRYLDLNLTINTSFVGGSTLVGLGAALALPRR